MRNDSRIVDIPEIDSPHVRAIGTALRSLIVRNASASRTSEELESLAEPRVDGQVAAFCHDSHAPSLKVCPESSVAPAQGAVALRQLSRLGLQFEFDGAAMAGSRIHVCRSSSYGATHNGFRCAVMKLRGGSVPPNALRAAIRFHRFAGDERFDLTFDIRHGAA